MHRWFVTVLAVLSGCIALPASAAAAEIDVTVDSNRLTLNSPDNDPGAYDLVEVVSQVLDGGTATHTIEVRSSTTTFNEALADCDVNGNVLTCSGLASNTLVANLGPGDDIFEFDDAFTGEVPVIVDGQGGNDLIK